MADNFGGSENIFFIDDANIVLIDPNSIIDSNGQKKDRTIKQENLVMYANLEVEAVPRTQLAVGQSLESGIQNVTLASINFLKPQGKEFFDTSYTDQYTAGKNFQGQVNERFFDSNQNPQQSNYVDTQLLGIKNIKVDIKFNGIPTVAIQLIDVQGKALFETGGNSPYSVFFYYPYPIFYLTLKGFYGKAIQYELMLTSFNASFETSTGNYIIDLKFIARTSAILDDIRLGYLFALPNMYPIYKTEAINNSSTSQQATGSLQQVDTGVSQQTTIIKTSKGRSKLEQVFQEYRDKELIDKSVPTLTLEEMSVNLTKYTQFLNQQFELLDFNNLLYLTKYEESLKSFNGEIQKWFTDNTDGKDVLVLKKDQINLYGLKDVNTFATAENNLTTILEKYKTQIASIPKYGQIISQPNNFYSIDSFKTKFIKTDINFTETYKKRVGTGQIPQNYENEIITFLEGKGTFTTNNPETSVESYNPFYYTSDIFEQNYIKQIQQVEDARIKESESLNQQLQTNLKSNGNPSNLPFRPTIRNVMGVIMASVDAFYRMMYDVHIQAWDQRDNKNRINSIIKPSTPSQEGKNSVETSQTQNVTNIVYPWPQFVQKTDIEGKSEYVITYPGSKSVVGFTKGYDSTTWPEVEFVEQFLYGLTVKELDYNSDVQQTPSVTLNYTPSSAIEIEFQDTIYREKDAIGFPYELYERILLNTFYSGLYYYTNNRIDLLINTGTDLEVENAFKSGIPNGELKDVIINTLPKNSYSLYQYFVDASNNGTGEKYRTLQSQEFTTNYIKDRVQNSTQLFSLDTYKKISKSPNGLNSFDKIKDFLNYETNEIFFDTFPFKIDEFRTKLESPTIKLYNTTNTYILDSQTITISNQKSNLLPFNKKESSSSGFQDSTVDNTTINTFYQSRFSSPKQRMLTEGNIKYTDSTRITNEQTTSMLNTPYFLNALLSAATITGDTRFIVPAFLFLNSLPLNTLYEKYIDNNGTKSDFIFPSLTKFSAVHKLPYAWILKMGSIWYRYKKYVEEEIDILDDNIWTDFNYKYAYDPQTLNTKKVYKNVTTSNGTIIKDFVLDDTNNLRLGFYPQLYNSVYKLITGSDLFDGNIEDNVETLSSNNSDRLKIFNGNYKGMSQSGPIIPYYAYLNTTSDDISKGLEPEFVNKIMIFPSAGYTPFSQASYQFSNRDIDTTIPKQSVNKIQTFNGSAKVFWEAPNYGWFDNNQIKKPKYNQYFKRVNTGTSQQYEFILSNNSEEYAEIEDLFGVFNKEQLDLFENEFKNFCKNDVTKSLFEDNNDVLYSNFREILKNILIIDNNSLVSSSDIAKKQTNTINGIINSFLNVNIQLKIGNPKEFNRKYFGSFINENNEKLKPMIPNPNPKSTYGEYEKGSLPGDSLNVTLSESESKFPNEWKLLKLNVGFSTIDGLRYGSKSYITDFFIDNNIKFTTDNITNLSKLIKIYATIKKQKNGDYDKDRFQEDIENIYNDIYNGSRNQIESAVTKKLPTKISSGNVPEQITITKVDGDNTKLEMWEAFKSINDKWVSAIDFSKKLLFDEFLFFDRSNRDIGDTFLINVESIRKYCSWENSNTSVMSLIRQLIVENKMNFFVLPAYINFYGKPSKMTTNRNQTILNNANDVFSTFGYVDYIDSSAKFLCQYIGRPSNTLSMDNDPKYPFKSDSFDLGVSAGNPIRNTATVNDEYKNNKAVGFVVDFGVTNQSVFKSFEIAQNQNVTSSEQIQVIVDMGRLGANKKVSQQTTALYELYKGRTYDCTLKTFGNVMLQPTMYFVVRHMPMFNGTYIIRNVNHDISPGQFNTTIQGQRVSSLSNQIITNELASINEDFTKKLENKIKTLSSNNNIVTLNSNSTSYLTGQQAKDLVISGRTPYQGNINNSIDITTQTCQENLWGYPDTTQSKLPNMPYIEESIDVNRLITELKNSENDKTMRLFLCSMFYLSGYNVNDKIYKIKMNNLFGSTGDIRWNIIENFNGYRCLNTDKVNPIPFLSFENISKSIISTSNYFIEKLRAYTADTKTQNLSLNLSQTDNVNELSRIFVKLWYDTWYTSGSTDKNYTDDGNQYLDWLNTVKYILNLAKRKNLID